VVDVQARHRPHVARRGSLTRTLRGAVSLGIVLGGLLALPSGTQAQTTIAAERAPTSVNAFRGRVVWSSFDPASGEYSLKVSRLGRVRKLGVRTRTVPFDVDLGPDAHGRAVAVYSRCRREEPVAYITDNGVMAHYERARGCHIYRYRFDTGRERRLNVPGMGRTSDYRPTIWGRTLVFARIFPHRRGVRGAYPFLYSMRLPDGAPQRLRGGTRGWYLARSEGGPGPVSLDLRGDQLAFAWFALLGRCPFQTEEDYAAGLAEVWLGRLGARPRLVDRGCQGDSGTPYRPNDTIGAHDLGFDGGELWYVQQRASGSFFRGYVPSTRSAESYPLPFAGLGLAVYRRTAYLTRSHCAGCDAVDVVRDRHLLQQSSP
jgi:hypothetical protein